MLNPNVGFQKILYRVLEIGIAGGNFVEIRNRAGSRSG
jgi:hypothetical protein